MKIEDGVEVNVCDVTVDDMASNVRLMAYCVRMHTELLMGFSNWSNQLQARIEELEKRGLH